jgi:membrane protein DedA with SNARE-associated domain
MEEVSTKIAYAILCVIMGEVANRSIFFLVGKWLNKQTSPTEEERLASLRRLQLVVM